MKRINFKRYKRYRFFLLYVIGFILLTNAVNPNRSYKNPNYFDYRTKIHSDVYKSLGLTEVNPNLIWRKKWD